MLAHPERRLSREEEESFERLLGRRLAREPLAYLLGEREFLSLDFLVSPAALIPRPETELLAELAIREARRRKFRLGLDLGTGCGCLAVGLAVNLPSLHMVATDISPEALALARQNARRHRVETRIRFLCSDLLRGLGTRFDFILANLPYVATPQLDQLEPEISRHEPRVALDGGPNGLDAFRRLLPALGAHLLRGGFAALELGAGQAAAVSELARESGLRVSEIRPDLAGLPRAILLETG